MILEHLLLTRFCQHQSRELSFHQGLNVIVGSIGTGKSNILGAIRFGLTNDSGNAGNRGEDVMFGTGKGAASGVEQVWVHKGHRFFLKRYIQPSAKSLVWEDSLEVKLTLDADIKRELYERLNLDQQLIDEFVMVPQGDIAAILDQEDSVRTSIMQQLVGLTRYSRLHAWMGDYITKKISLPVYDDPQKVKQQIDSLIVDRDTAQASLESVRQKIVPDTEAIRQRISDAENVSELKKRIEEKKLAVGRLSGDRANWQLRLSSSVPRCRELEISVSTKNAAYHDLYQKASAWDAYNLAFSKRDPLEKELAACQSSLPEPVKPEGYIPSTDPEFSRQVDFLTKEIGLLEVKKRFKDLGKDVCPTCLRSVDEALQGELVQVDDRLAQARSEQMATATRNLGYLNFEKALFSHKAEVQRRAERIPQLLQLLEGIVFPEKPEGDYDQLSREARQIYADMDRDSREFRNVVGDQQSCRIAISQLDGRIEAETKQIEQWEESARQLAALSPEDIKLLRSNLAEQEQLRISAAHLEGRLNVITNQLPALQEQLAKVLELEKKHQLTVALREDLVKGREVFHRTNLPRIMAQQSMFQLAGEMNKVLEAFSATYRVVPGDGTKFQAQFGDPDKGVQPDARLSGGERAQFGLALRVAAHSIWAHELGFLCLDEPTYGFGADDMNCVKLAIERLRQLSSNQGLQVILVTHERSLLPLFDHVIDLDGG